MANRSTIRSKAKRFEKLRTVFEFAHWLGREEAKLQLLSFKPRYKEYQIPKPGGGWRQIEDPEPKLKSVLQKLNEHLQACYYSVRPASAYGFVISASEDEDRNIVTNAKKHLGCKHLLNIDLKDFFHQIREDKVVAIFSRHFPQFEDALIDLLARLVCYKARLPMGAPTSPVLSNYAAIPLDEQLMAYCSQSGISYTRYADDLSFSSKQAISRIDYEHFLHCVQTCGFEVNPKKIRWAKENNPKEITGLFLKMGEVCLEENYLRQLETEIGRYITYYEVEARYRTGASMKKLKLFEQELRGKLSFAQLVEPDNERIDYLRDQMDQAKEALEDFESVHWLDLPYGF
ncbi:MAG: RNA-directed DNA polymerase [Saprospiraceae bacterium]|nr:RNA-directed DNA polymerase [Saprospiraceae bacterium]